MGVIFDIIMLYLERWELCPKKKRKKAAVHLKGVVAAAGKASNCFSVFYWGLLFLLLVCGSQKLIAITAIWGAVIIALLALRKQRSN